MGIFYLYKMGKIEGDYEMNYKDISDHDKKEIDKFKLFLAGELRPVEQREYEGYPTPKKICTRYQIIEQYGFAVCKDCEHVVNTHDRNKDDKWVCSECVEIWQEEEKLDYCKHVPPLKWYKLSDNTRLCENCHKEIHPRWLK